jgi:hypothetical protein
MQTQKRSETIRLRLGHDHPVPVRRKPVGPNALVACDLTHDAHRTAEQIVKRRRRTQPLKQPAKVRWPALLRALLRALLNGRL